MPTLRDVAKRAGVALSTVSAILNERPDCYASEETRRRVLEAAAELGYRPHLIARSLAKGKTDTIGLIVYGLTNPFFAYIVDEVEKAVRASGYHLLLCNNRDAQGMNDKVNLEIMIERRVDGVLLWASHDGYSIPLPNPDSLKVVVLGYRTADGTDYVALDRAYGTYLAARHLIELGHKRFGYLAPKNALSPQHPKLAGLLRALREEGLPEPLLLPTLDDSRLDGRIAAQKARDWHPRPTALLCYNDLLAIGAYWGLKDAGLSVPDDVALVGFDGIEESEYLVVPLTTVKQPILEMCQTAVHFLLNQIKGQVSEPQQVTLKPTLVVRQSSVGTRNLELL